jgi:PadR family transcriptional regulator, regulatory protein PadR
MSSLSELEVFALTGIFASGENAYAVTIFEEVEKLVGSSKEVSLGSLYVTLDRLEKKGYLRSSYGEPTKERGGRRRRQFVLTALGIKALKTALAPLQRTLQATESLLKANAS